MVISIALQKGGTGKTSSSNSLATGFTRRGKRGFSHWSTVKPIPPKCFSRTMRILEKRKRTTTRFGGQALAVRSTLISNLDIVPSHILRSNTDIELTTAMDRREELLKSKLEKIKAQYNCVLIDCPLYCHGWRSPRLPPAKRFWLSPLSAISNSIRSSKCENTLPQQETDTRAKNNFGELIRRVYTTGNRGERWRSNYDR